RADGYRRRGHARELQRAKLSDVRAGGDCRQPRLLQFEPALGGPPPWGPADRSQTKARWLLTHAVAPRGRKRRRRNRLLLSSFPGNDDGRVDEDLFRDGSENPLPARLFPL